MRNEYFIIQLPTIFVVLLYNLLMLQKKLLLLSKYKSSVEACFVTVGVNRDRQLVSVFCLFLNYVSVVL